MKSVLFCLTLLLCVTVTAQSKTIVGTISDESGLPLPGVKIIVKGTTTGTNTNFDGLYSIKTQVGDVLEYTYVGYETEERTVGDVTTISFSMTPSSEGLDEVVVTSYGISRSYTPSASQIARQERKSYHRQLANKLQGNTGVATQLSGKVAGVQVTAEPQTSSRIVIRGNSSIKGNQKPMVIVDGKMQGSDFDLGNVNTNSIKNISVLKDASATSLYGSRASNGVLVVTTKNGLTESKKPLYIVDGQPIRQVDNSLVESIPETEIDSKVEYKSSDAKKKFGRIAKHGCIVITTTNGDFRISDNESYAVIDENAFENTQTSPLSTFSIDVDKASYSNIRRMINNGQAVDTDAVKIEEMINYFDYNYPQPTGEHPFSINTELVQTPWNQDTKLVRIGLQGKTYDQADLPPSNLTFLIDVSGSMYAQNKLPLLKQAFKLLVNQLREQDKVSIVVYSGSAGVVLEPTSGKHKEKILKAIDNLRAGGSTAGGAGIKRAYQLAEKHFKKKGNNRVILATDGDFNVGASSDKAMEDLIVEKRKSGVFLSVLGFGYGNYKDSKLETLADKGNGNHAYIDNMQEAQKVFGKEFGGTLFTIAKDVKIQVEFNPVKVQAYRLIGYENRLLADEDFIDDTKDAGELGSGHDVTALYEIIPVGVKSDYLKDVHELKYTESKASTGFSDELLTVKFRYKKPDGDTSTEMVHVQKDQLTEATDDMEFCSAVALLGMQLRQSQYHNSSTLNDVVSLANNGRGKDNDGYRAEFVRLVKTYQGI